MSLIPASHFCVPDAYLTNERLNILFNGTHHHHLLFPPNSNLVQSSTSVSPTPSPVQQYSPISSITYSPSTTAISRSATDPPQVRQLYVSEILVLQQDLVTRTTPHESESTSTQHDCQLAAQHDQLAAQHEREVKALKERHDQKLCEISREREVERAKWGKSIPTEWLVGIDVSILDNCSTQPNPTNG